jgi:hypothetical protein
MRKHCSLVRVLEPILDFRFSKLLATDYMAVLYGIFLLHPYIRVEDVEARETSPHKSLASCCRRKNNDH